MSYDILDSDFNKKLSTAYQLSILGGTDSLVYSVFDTASNNVLLLKTLAYASQAAPGQPIDLGKELKAVFSRDELLGFLFRRVKITMPDITAVLVPDRLYNEYEKTTYFTELSSQTHPDAVQTDEIPELSVKVVYPLDANLWSVFKKQFPTARYYNNATPLLLGWRRILDPQQPFQLFAHISGKSLHLALFEKQGLLFYNTFPFSAAGDVLYYVLLTYNQFGLDPARQGLSLSGQVLENAEIYKLLHRYIAQVGFLRLPDFLNFGRKFQDMPAHLFFELYSLALCK